MTSMVEKMAWSLFDREMAPFVALEMAACDWDGCKTDYPEAYQRHLSEARAALTALLEPSDAMIESYYSEPLDDPQYITSDDGATKRFKAMIRTALDEAE